jgi:hypothetical protein
MKYAITHHFGLIKGKYAITHHFGLIKGKGICGFSLPVNFVAAVVEEIAVPSHTTISYRVVFRAIRQDTQEVIERSLC